MGLNNLESALRGTGRELLVTPDRVATELRQHLAAGQRVMIVGGPSGSYEIDHDDRFVHYASTETTERTAARFSIPHKVGALLLTKNVGLNLQRIAIDKAREAGVDTYGPMTSVGAVNRVIREVHSQERAGRPEVVSSGPPVRIVLPPDIVSATVAAAVVAPDVASTLTNDELAVVKVFEEAEAALSLAKETALTVLRQSILARAEAQKNAAAKETIDALKRLLGDSK